MSSLGWQSYELSKQLTLGVGIGIGIGIILKRLLQQKQEQRMMLKYSLDQLTIEVKALRESLLLNEKLLNGERTGAVYQEASSFNYDEEDGNEEDNEDEFELALSETDEEFSLAEDQDIENRIKLPFENLNESLEEIDRLLGSDDQDKHQAYNILKEKTKQYPRDADLLWRMAHAQYHVAAMLVSKDDIERKKRHIEKGIAAADESLQLKEDSAQAHRWYAILKGMQIEYAPVEEKIKMGYIYKQHIERAIQLDPTEPSAYSLLGRWCFEVYMMPWYVRKVASALYSEPPSSTVNEALGYFLKAEELKPGFWKMNSLFIGKCYYQKSDYRQAKEWLTKARNLPVKGPEDETCQIEINTLLGKL